MNDNKKDVIDLVMVYRHLMAKKRRFLKVIPIVFVLSCVWIFPEPRYYKCKVTLAPETTGENIAGGLSSIASQFGVNLGGASADAIYPLLYPDLMESNNFMIGLMDIKVKSADGTVDTDYYTYMTKHQKKNQLTRPFKKLAGAVSKLMESKDEAVAPKPKGGKRIDPFRLSKKDYELVSLLKTKITCKVDKKTDVITITVEDQDPLICATMADSVRQHLQVFITEYRTNKARLDVEHYKKLSVNAKKEYEACVREYSDFCDSNQEVTLQSFVSKRDELENEMQLKYNTYTAMQTQLEAMRAKLQERTPAFTTLQNATVPVKPAGPKRMLFVLGMCFIATFLTAFWTVRKDIFEKPDSYTAGQPTDSADEP